MKPHTLATVRQSLAPAEPWHTPLYLAQVFTYRLAASMTGDFRNVSTGEDAHRPPFCLRLRSAYRTPAEQEFRDTVARAARQSRRPRPVKASWLSKWDMVPDSPKPIARARVAELLRASRSRRGRGNAWRTAAGYWIRDAGLALTREIA